MNDLASTFYTALNNETGAGEALVSVSGKFFRDENDLARSRVVAQDFPVAWLRVDPASPRDNMRGSVWQVLDGRIVINMITAVDANADNGWDAARQSCETLCAAFERVLAGLRFKTSATNSLGCWHDMTFSVSEGGAVEGGPASFAGLACYGKAIDCRFTFRRRRTA